MTLPRKIHCFACEAANWLTRTTCRRCGKALPQSTEPCERCKATAARLRLITKAAAATETGTSPILFGDPLPSLRDVETALMLEALRRNEGSMLKAAAALKIGKTTIYRRVHLLDAEKPSAPARAEG